jgi:uncharacterized membrane protein
LSETTNRRAELGLERVVFFSDAIMAIAITLLVLDLRLPEGSDLSLAAQLDSLGSSYFSFLVSFGVIGLFWEAHLRLFGFIARVDRALLWLNLTFLLFIAFLPFPTSVLGKHWSPTAIVFYAATLMATGLLRFLLLRHAVRHRLIAPEVDPATLRTEHWRAATVPVVFLLSILVAGFAPRWAPACWLLLIPVSVLGRRLVGRRP